MKKLILLTSALTFVGGAASATITVTGEASVAYGNWETVAGTAAAFAFNTGVTIVLEETSGDVTYGAKATIDADAGTVGGGVIWVAAGFGKFSFGVDEFGAIASDLDGVLDVNGATGDEDQGDVKAELTFGAASVTLVAAVAGVGLGPNAWDLALKYAGTGWNFGVDTDSGGTSKVSGDLEVGSFTLGAAYDTTAAWDVWAKTTFGAINVKATADSAAVYGVALDGKAGNVSWKLAADSAAAVSASADLALGDMTIGLAYDNDDAGFAGVADRGDAADIQATFGYKMDMLAFALKVNSVSEYEIKMTGKFEF